MTFEINIGLENNPLTYKELKLVVKETFNTDLIRKDLGKFNENPERTLIARFEAKGEAKNVFRTLEDFCTKLTQESIALYMDESYGVLIFNKDYKGEKYPFDIKYFIPY